ncbi:MAG: hypothetical protein ACUVRO_12670 [Armatimonadota bacterium]
MDFVFAFGELSPILMQKLRQTFTSIWGDIHEISEAGFYLCYPSSQPSYYLVDNEEFVGCIDGWAGVHNLRDWKRGIYEFYRTIRSQWPLTGESITGSFVGLLYDRGARSIKIFSDLGGILPLYYCVHDSQLIGGTSLITFGRTLSPELDVIGLIQRASPPHYMNYGDKTILKNVYRLLPGEMRHYDSNLNVMVMWDNDLYMEGVKRATPQTVRELWDIIQADVALSVAPYDDHIYLAMSGGWDSRLVAGALHETGKKLTCLTYGTSEDEYEVRIARRCAEILGAEFMFCDVYPSYFPTRKDFIENLSHGEGTENTVWFSVLAKAPPGTQVPIVLGDLFQVATGQGIAALSTRQAERNRAFGFPERATARRPGGPKEFRKWSNGVLDSVLNAQVKQISILSPRLLEGYKNADIVELLAEALRSALNRIAFFNPPYAVLYDELLNWHVHGQNKQLLCLKQRYSPVAASMGVRTVRAESLFDPIDRASKKLLHEIQRLPAFSRLSSLPSAAIPFIPSSSPLRLKHFVWGARWFIDQQLIKQALKARNPEARLRVLKSLDLVRLYNHPEASERVRSWFSDKVFSDPQIFLDIVRDRATLAAWPLINGDIVGAASASILVDLIYADSLS